VRIIKFGGKKLKDIIHIQIMDSIRNNKKVVRLILGIVGFLICISAPYYSWIFLLPGLFLILINIFITDTELTVYNNRFEIDHWSIVDLFSSKEVFNYNNILKIKFDKGFSNILGVLTDPNSIFYNQTNSKPDTIEIVMKDNSFRIINSIGDKNKFRNICDMIIRKINDDNKHNINY
jgi:hypothetical protein